MENFLISNYNDKIVLDVSSLPFLKNILNTLTDVNRPITVYIPDTIKKLLDKAKQNTIYYEYLDKLISKWTNKIIDYDFIEKILKEGKYNNVTVISAGEDYVDERLFTDILSNIYSKDLMPEFSPRFNLLGDLIGKILGIAKRQSAYIIMKTKKIISLLKNKLAIFQDSIRDFHQEKLEFFKHNFPQLLRIIDSRWYIGIILTGISFAYTGSEISVASLVLAVFDP